MKFVSFLQNKRANPRIRPLQSPCADKGASALNEPICISVVCVGFLASFPALPTAFLHGSAPACVFCLYYNRIFLQDSTKIVIFTEKPKCGNFLEMRVDFSTFVYMDRGEIIIYQTADGETCLDVRMENDSVWLTQAQMVELFNSTKQNVSLHINNLFKEGELEREATVKEYLIVQQEGHRSVKRKITAYNLDVIISVGYRVKSQRGTQFRIWANKVLKEYLIKGYAVNSQAKIEQLEELKQTVRLLSNVLATKDITRSEAVGLLRVITDYTYGLDTLDRYDYQQLEVSATTTEEPFHATYENAMEALQVLRDKFGGSELFAHEKDESFKSTMGAIYQTFGGHDLYPSVEEKAANLLYLTVKNHSFSDGNKRIAAFLFLWFLENNRILYRADGSRLLDNNTLVALTLMIAESRTEEKDVMTKVVVNLINKNN